MTLISSNRMSLLDRRRSVHKVIAGSIGIIISSGHTCLVIISRSKLSALVVDTDVMLVRGGRTLTVTGDGGLTHTSMTVRLINLIDIDIVGGGVLRLVGTSS